MVVGVLVIGLQQVVVNGLGGQFDLDPRQPHGDKLKHGHGAGGIL